MSPARQRTSGVARKGVRGGQGRNSLFYALAALSTLCVLALQAFDPPALREHVESLTYDARMGARASAFDNPLSGDVLIVSVDEQSLAGIGRWPWPRDVQARLIGLISNDSPAAIGVDILYSEREEPASDAALAAAVGNTGNTVLAAAFVHEEGIGSPNTDYLWEHAFTSVKGNKEMPWKDWLVRPAGVLVPPEELASAGMLGSVLSPPDRDGVIRHETLYLYYEDDVYPSMALQMARLFLGVTMDRMRLIAGRGVELGGRLIETDLEGRLLIDYYGAEGTFRYISALDVLRGRIKPGTFTGKAVFVGTSAIATYDQKVTPLSANMPGVEKHATVLKNIITNRGIRRVHVAWEMLATLLCGLLMALPLIHMMALRGSCFALLALCAFIALSYWLFVYNGLWLVMLYPLVNMTVIATTHTGGRYLIEERRARKIRRMFSSYVSPAVVTTLIEEPEQARLGGHNREVTVLFSDIVGFTSMSEGMSPEQIVDHLNEYFKTMTDVIFHWKGTFDKIVGDEIMAFWNAPVAQPDHAELACRCALNMFHKLEQLHRKWQSEGKPLIDIGIGLNTGKVLVGNIGAEDKKMDYTIIGDHVNAGARVEALTRQYKARILMTEFTAAHIRDAVQLGHFGHMQLNYRGATLVKGKERELGIYELVETRED